MTKTEKQTLLIEYKNLVSAAVFYRLKGAQEESFRLCLQHQALMDALKKVGITPQELVDTYEQGAIQATENYHKIKA